MIKIIEEVVLVGKKRKKILAKIDTGAWRTSLDKDLADEIGFDKTGAKKGFKSALGRGCRELISLKFIISGKEIETIGSITDRSNMKYKMIIGRRDLSGMTIKVDK